MPPLPAHEDILKKLSLKGTNLSVPAHGDVVSNLPTPSLPSHTQILDQLKPAGVLNTFFGTKETNVPGNPLRGGLVGQGIRSAYEKFEKGEEERKKTQTIGEDFVTQFVNRPGKIIKTVVVDLPRIFAGGFSAVGKSVLEELYTNEHSPFTKGARAIGLDTSRTGVRKELSKPELEKKLFKFETESWQSITDKVNQFTASTPIAKDWEKKYLGTIVGVGGFLLDAYIGPPGKGVLTSEILKELIESTTDDIAYSTMLKAGIPSELARASATGVARAKTAQEVEIAIKGQAAQILKQTSEAAVPPKLLVEPNINKEPKWLLGDEAALTQKTLKVGEPIHPAGTKDVWIVTDVGETGQFKIASRADVEAIGNSRMADKNVPNHLKLTMNLPQETVAPVISKELQPLAQEVKKYKSAEEFVKAQGKPLYHGTNADFTTFDLSKAGTGEGSNMLGKGIYLAKNQEKASSYGKNMVESYLAKDAKIVDWHSLKHDPRYNKFFDANEKVYKEKYGFGVNDNWLDHIKEDFAKKYFDAVSYGNKEVIVINPNKVKTKSQLTDFYNKATGNKPDEAFNIAGERKLRPAEMLSKDEAVKTFRKFFTEQESGFLVTDKPIGKFQAEGSAIYGVNLRSMEFENLVKIIERNGQVEDHTLYHEIFEKAVQVALDPNEVAQAIDKVIKNPLSGILRGDYNREAYNTKELRAKELLADDFAEYLRDKSGYKGEYRTIWEKLLGKIREWVRKMSGAQKLYEDVVNQRRAGGSKLRTIEFEAPKNPERSLFSEDDSLELAAKEEASGEFALRRSKIEEEKVVSNLQAIFADMKGVSTQDLEIKFSEQEINQAELHYQFVSDSLIDDPARALVKYTSKSTGKLPEVTGKETIQSLKGGKSVMVKNSEFGKHGDDIVTELGFKTPEEAQVALEKYQARKTEALKWFEKVREIHKNIRLAKQADNFVGHEKNRLAGELAQNLKGLQGLVQAAERAGFRKGFSEGNKRYHGLVERLKARRSKITAIQDALNLTDTEMKKARGAKDPRFMTDQEFDNYLEGVRKGAEHIHKRNEERLLVDTIIKERELKKPENLQKALQFPTIDHMSYEQLVEFGDMLAQTAPGDTFLGPRMIQTAVNTDLGNIKTIGEGIKAVAKQTGMAYADPVEGSKLDRWMRDPTLVEKDPLHKLFITEWVAKEANMLTQEHALKKELNKLAGAARKARRVRDGQLRKAGQIKQSLRDRIFARLAPEDKLVVQWLQPFEVSYSEDGFKTITRVPELRARAEAAMTGAELEYARFLEKFFSHYYAIAENEAKTRWTLQGVKHTNYKQIYYTHMNRAFFERWNHDGLVKALKIAWSKNAQETRVDFNAFGDRGEVLGYEKWLNRAMTREGEGIDKETGQVLYTQNTAKVAVSYHHAFERKLILDAMVPKIKLLEFIMGKRFKTPKSINNPEGTEKVHSQLTRSLNEWINNKKGQRVEMIYQQGDKVEAFVDTASLLISLLDLGGNIITQTASAVGGELMTLRGAKFMGWARGHKRALFNTDLGKQGRLLGNKYAGVIGPSPWFEIANVANDAGDTLVSGLFYIFADLSYRARRQMFLGLLTKEEFETGIITTKRQAEIKIEIGKWHPLPEFRSVAGSTSLVKAASKYAEWATPAFQKSTQDLSKLIKEMRFLAGDESKLKTLTGSKHFKELLLTVLVGIGAYAAGQLIFNPDKEDQTFTGQLKNKAAREAGSIIQAMTGLGVFVNVRMLGFMQDLAKAVATLTLLEKYESAGPGHEEGDFKFPSAFGNVLIPNSIEPFLPEKETPLKTIEDLKKEALERIDSGEMTVSAAKAKFLSEKKSIEETKKKRRFEMDRKEYVADLRERIETKEVSVKQGKKEFTEYLKAQKKYAPESFESNSDAGFIGKIKIAAEGLRTDPVTVFEAIFTGEEIRRMDNGAIILHRGKTSDPLGQKEFSIEERKKRDATKDLILDHTVPLQLGGDNSNGNLKLVPKAEWEKYTPVENYLGQALRAGELNEKEARRIIKEFKAGEISEAELYEEVDGSSTLSEEENLAPRQ